jgi:hypothetical protein
MFYTGLYCVTMPQTRYNYGLSENNRFYNPVFHQFPGIEYFDINRSALPVPMHTIVIHLRIMPEVMHGKIFVNGFKE